MCCDILLIILLFFFFKQKTAYEMRISDWSSDVCSSDLFLFGLGDLVLIAVLVFEHGGDAIVVRLECFPQRPSDDRGANRSSLRRQRLEIGRASCRERVCQYV